LPAVGLLAAGILQKTKKNVLQLLNKYLILQQIDSIRKYQPRCGGRKLFIELQPFLKQHKIATGRDNFF
jgi:type I restriction-modification system DNA methylase subunit